VHSLTLAEVAPAPAAAAGLIYAAAFVVILGTWVCAGMLKAYATTLGHFIRWLAAEIDVTIFHAHPLRGISRGLLAIDTAIRNGFAAGVEAGDQASAWLLGQAHIVWRWTAKEIADLSRDVWVALQRTTVQTIPQSIRRAEAATLARLRGIDHTVGRIEAQAHALERRLLNGIDRVTTIATRTIPHEIAGVRSRVGQLERRARTAEGRLSRVEKALGIAALTAVVSTVLSRLGLRWLRCSNVTRTGKALCCVDPSLLESVLADALLIVGTLSLVEFTKEMQTVTGDAAGLVQRFWRAA